MSTYTPLIEALQSEVRHEITLTFEQLEEVLGRRLPDSAVTYAAYWSSGNHVGRLLAEIGWRASLRRAESVVRFSRAGTPGDQVTQPVLEPLGHSAASDLDSPDFLLLGCVKTQHPGRHRARDLYGSTLFAGRRSRAETTGKPWFILSAKYGLLSPDAEVDNYDHPLKELGAAALREWSERVLVQLDQAVGSAAGKLIEIHAGSEYRDHGLIAGLRERGARVSVPLQGLRLGEQLRWYKGRDPELSSPATPTTPAPFRVSSVRGGPPISDADARSITATLTAEFNQGGWDLSARSDAPAVGWAAMPEFRAVETVRGAGATDVQIRLMLTFGAAMDRARDADLLWDAVARLFLDRSETFDVRTVVAEGPGRLQSTLTEFGVSQRHGPDSAAWFRIAESLRAGDAPHSVGRAIVEGRGDAVELQRDVTGSDDSGESWFPLLRGPKISALWIRMLAVPGEAEIQRLSSLPVAVDVQVKKVSEYLGITDTADLPVEQARRQIQDRWEALAGAAVGPATLEGTASAVDPALWFFGKWGCTRCERAGALLPISRLCSNCRFEVRAG